VVDIKICYAELGAAYGDYDNMSVSADAWIAKHFDTKTPCSINSKFSQTVIKDDKVFGSNV
jgi:hypothetical protein